MTTMRYREMFALAAVVALPAMAQDATAQTGDCPVAVTARNVGWAWRPTAEGGVLDMTNRIGTTVRGGKPTFDLGKIGHASVFYKPTGRTYTFDLAPTSTLSVALGGSMPDFPARFADTNLYAAVDIPAPFDVGTTADRPSQQHNSNRWDPRFLVKTVPCEMFTRGWALCAVSDDPKAERKFTVRITRWDDSKDTDYRGRSVYAMATRLVDFDKAKKEQVGWVELRGERGESSSTANGQPATKKTPLWLVEFPIDMGDIQDVVHTDEHGNFLGELGRYLDFEV